MDFHDKHELVQVDFHDKQEQVDFQDKQEQVDIQDKQHDQVHFHD